MRCFPGGTLRENCDNLDVMHIEKNICDKLIGTLLNIDGKTKDTVKVRLDLEVMGIRQELHTSMPNTWKQNMPPASYILSIRNKEIFCRVLKLVSLQIVMWLT